MKSLRIGCVQYLNAWPLIRGWPGQIAFGHPAALSEQLQRGALEIALVSSFEFLRNPIYRVVDGVSISCDGPVYSVVVAHRDEISEIEEIVLDPASLTSVALLRCLLAERGLTPRFVTSDALESGPAQKTLGRTGCQPAVAGDLPAPPVADSPSTSREASRQAAKEHRLTARAPQSSFAPRRARLLIGDQAIRFRKEHAQDFKFWDLGEVWKKMTNLPFVFALWLVRPGASDATVIADNLRELCDTNLRNLDQLIAEETDFDHAFCRRYFLDHLRFSFGEKEKQGLQTFAASCATHGLIPKRELALNVV